MNEYEIKKKIIEKEHEELKKDLLHIELILRKQIDFVNRDILPPETDEDREVVIAVTKYLVEYLNNQKKLKRMYESFECKAEKLVHMIKN